MPSKIDTHYWIPGDICHIFWWNSGPKTGFYNNKREGVRSSKKFWSKMFTWVHSSINKSKMKKKANYRVELPQIRFYSWLLMEKSRIFCRQVIWVMREAHPVEANWQQSCVWVLSLVAYPDRCLDCVTTIPVIVSMYPPPHHHHNQTHSHHSRDGQEKNLYNFRRFSFRRKWNIYNLLRELKIKPVFFARMWSTIHRLAKGIVIIPERQTKN